MMCYTTWMFGVRGRRIGELNLIIGGVLVYECEIAQMLTQDYREILLKLLSCPYKAQFN